MTFLFTSGVENSYPTLPSGVRVDQMEKCGHYGWWEEDFGLARELRLDALRYGPAYYRTHVAPDRFDWEPADAPMRRLEELGLEVIADLCHFGVPSWLGGFSGRRVPGAVPGVRACVRPSLSVGALLHAGERDLRLRELLGAARMVERVRGE